MKRFIYSFLLTVICAVFFCFTTSAAEITEYSTTVDDSNSWRYENGKPINDQYSTTPFYIPSHPDATLTGIDVSHHQGQINWEKVKSAGVDFAIIRCGFAEDNPSYDDKYWEYNTSECERLNIPYGVYLYSYATIVEDALSEADHVLRLIDGHNLSFPVYLDMEDNSTINSDLSSIATAFCNKISAAGHPVGIYANLNWWTYYLADDCFDNWYRWIAQWNESCEYRGEYAIWQYGCTGVVSGIEGNVDMNFLINTPDDHKGWKEKLDTPEVTLDTDTVTGKTILSWNTIANANEYQVWRKTEGYRYMLYQTVTDAFLADVDVVNNNAYYYLIKAISFDTNKGDSYFSDVKIKEAVVDPIILNGYIREDNTKYNGKPRITWNSVTGAKNYQVYRSLSGESGTFFRISTTVNTSLTNTSTNAGNTYYYKVRAIFDDGSKGVFSNVVELTI